MQWPVFPDRVDSACVTVELLECGHVQPRVQDAYGETHAVRRRCHRCYRGKPRDVYEPFAHEAVERARQVYEEATLNRIFPERPTT